MPSTAPSTTQLPLPHTSPSTPQFVPYACEKPWKSAYWDSASVLCLRPSWRQKRGRDQEQEVTGSRVGLQSEQLAPSWGDCAVDSSWGLSQWSSCGLRPGLGP